MALTAARTLTGGTSSEGRVSGYVFKLVRESLGVTQQGLAEHLSVGVATIQGWESGRRPLMAMPAGNFLALRNRLRCLGATSQLLRVLTLALETDHFLAEALATPHHQAEPAAHALGLWVLSRPLTEMTAWPISGRVPDGLRQPSRRRGRRGPVPAGPALGADERRHVLTHLQAVAERASRHEPDGLLLRRQAYYLLGFDTASGTAEWLTVMYRADQRALPPTRGWSVTWPLARSTASALTRVGDPEPMRRFIADQLCDEAGETANLNYWAFWTGELGDRQDCDAFIGSTSLSAWHGRRLIRHLLDRLHGNIGFMELNIHSLWSLIRIRPDMAAGPALVGELDTKIGCLLDENLVSASARRELEAVRYGIAMARRD
jgi:transcriptional regulator with XRE-family HTH domain